MGYYVLSNAAGGQFKFVLKADNHETILKSETYASKAGANNGIESIRANCKSDANYARLTAKDGSPYFNLRAANGQVIGTSEMYSSTTARDNGIESCKRNGPSTTVRDETA